MNQKPKTTNLTELSLNRAIVKMSVPTILWMLVEWLFHLVDSYWIGKLGAGPFAAAASTSFILWMFFGLADISAIAVNALSAQTVGSGRSEMVKEYLRRCMMVSFVLSIVIAALCFPFRQVCFVLLGLEPVVVSDAVSYLTPWMIGLPVIFIAACVASVFRAVGDPKTPTILMMFLVVVNFFLDPLLIFGWGPIPALGLKGAAFCSVLCHFLFLVPSIIILHKRGLFPSYDGPAFFSVKKDQIIKIFRIGLPIALNGAIFSITYVGLTWVIARFGSESVAAIGIGHRIESFPWFFTFGFNIAAATLVGQYLGANQPELAAKATWRCCAASFIFVLAFIAAVYLSIGSIIQLFIDDRLVIEIGSEYLKIVSVCWLLGCFEVVLEGAFSGAGNTLPPMVIGIPFTVLRIPAAYFLAITLSWGTDGIWWAIGLSAAIKGMLLIIWFMKGNWKSPKIIQS